MNATVSMFVLVCRYLQQHAANRACSAMSAMMMFLFVAATLRGGREAALSRDSFVRALADEQSAWSEIQPEEWFRGGLRQGRWLYLPPLGSQALAEGVSKIQESSYHARAGLEPAHRLDLSDGALSWTPLLRRLGSLDLGFLTLVFLPLWALLVAHDAICGEKWRGTLRIALSGSVTRSRLLLAKALAVWIFLALPMTTAILVGLGLARLIFAAPPFEFGRLVAVLGISCAYLAFYVSAGLLASTCSAHPRTSLSIAVSVWVLCTFAVPRGAVLVANSVEGRPSSVLHEIDKRAALADSRRSFVEEHHSGATAHWMVERLTVAAKTLTKEEALQEEFDRKTRSARALEERLACLSPFGLAYSAMVEAAGTGTVRFERFRAQARAYRRLLTDYFANTIERLPTGADGQRSLRLPAAEAQRVLDATPRFVFQETPFRESAPGVLARGAVIAVLALLALAAALFNFRRYDVR